MSLLFAGGQSEYSVCIHVCFWSSWMTIQTLAKTPTSLNWVKTRMREKKGGGRDDFSLPPYLCAELRTITVNGRGLGRRNQVGVEKWRGKGAGGGEGVGWGWCEDENWFIAALMRSGMPGDSGCSPSPCCGNIKRYRGPPSCYNCCGDLSKGSRSLRRNLCNPDW